MSIQKFQFEYGAHEAGCVFNVNTDVFTKEHAEATLNFFTWDYNKENDPVKEVLHKYAMEVIKVASRYSFNVRGVISDFDTKEGFAKIDGSSGISLVSVRPYEFNEDELYCMVS